jgi:Ca2+-binding RTX toxin-like protein
MNSQHNPESSLPMPRLFGPEFLVNTFTEGSQFHSQTTALANGAFVVTWVDTSNRADDTSGTALRAQVFAANGSKLGAEFLVNTAPFGEQTELSLTALKDGSFVVAWTDFSQSTTDTSEYALLSQHFSATGGKIGAPLLVPVTTTNSQTDAAMTTLSNGDYVVTWGDTSSSTSSTYLTSVKLRIFHADGSAASTEISVNTTTAGKQLANSVTALSTGGFVVSWTDGGHIGADTDGVALRAQIFSASGAKVGNDILLNTSTTGSQVRSDVTALADGRFAATWESYPNFTVQRVYTQVFAADGSKIGTEHLVSEFGVSVERADPEIATLADGRYMIAWADASHLGGDATGYAIRAQIFSASGLPDGAAFDVNTTTKSDQYEPSIAVLTDGRVMISWNDLSFAGPGDTSGFAVRGQIIDPRIAAVNVAGTIGNDDLIGTSFADKLRGGLGNDRILGTGGADFLRGDNGNDSLDGGVGNDRIWSGVGADVLTGGAGADVMIFTSAAEAKGDKITDFEHLMDKISLTAFMPGGHFVGSAALSAAGDVRYDQTSGILSGDVNGDGRADWTLTLQNKALLTDADFVF